MQTNEFWMQINNKTNQCSCMLRNRMTETRAAFCWYSLLKHKISRLNWIYIYNCDTSKHCSGIWLTGRVTRRVWYNVLLRFCSWSKNTTVRPDKGVRSLSMFGNLHIKSSFITLRLFSTRFVSDLWQLRISCDYKQYPNSCD